MDPQNRRVVQATPNVNSQEGTPSVHPSSYLSSPLHSRHERSEMEESLSSTVGGNLRSPSTDISMSSQSQFEDVIVGTDIVVTEVMSVFKQFLEDYQADGDENGTYIRKINQLIEENNHYLDLDCHDLQSFPTTTKLYDQLILFPQKIIQVFDVVINELVSTLHPSDPFSIHVHVFNIGKKYPMRDLSTDNIDQLVCIEGMITRVGDLIPDIRIASFQCSACKHPMEVPRVGNRIDQPTRCAHCHGQNTMQLDPNSSIFNDKQIVKMQEVPDQVPQGETPQSVTLFASEELFDGVKPGDKVEVTGIFRAFPMRISQRKSTVRDVFSTFIDVLHYRRKTDERYAAEDDDALARQQMEEEKKREEAQLIELSHDPQIYEKLTASIAPSIWGMEDVKKGLLCMLFGGNQPDTQTGVHSRGDINILLCGDPGTSKSQLLSCVHQLAPRGIYTSGKGSSAVGLTAYVTRDPETYDLILESGALVLSDKGICCIDEFDKMDDTTRSVLHEAMEQQTISVAKAGIICTLNARTSILAAANPVNSRYDPNLSVMQNLQLPPTLLSRFDLIYLILDKPTQESDRKLATHLISLYTEHPEELVDVAPIDKKTLTAYISYARKNIKPIITDESAVQLEEEYVRMRNQGARSSAGNVVTATPRQLESLIRLSEALAKMKLSKEVSVDDVKEAARLINVATQRAATDPRTGVINMSSIYTE